MVQIPAGCSENKFDILDSYNHFLAAEHAISISRLVVLNGKPMTFSHFEIVIKVRISTVSESVRIWYKFLHIHLTKIKR